MIIENFVKADFVVEFTLVKSVDIFLDFFCVIFEVVFYLVVYSVERARRELFVLRKRRMNGSLVFYFLLFSCLFFLEICLLSFFWRT